MRKAGAPTTRGLKYAALGLFAGQVCGAAALYVRWGDTSLSLMPGIQWPLLIAMLLALLAGLLAALSAPRRISFVLAYATLALSAVVTGTTFASAIQQTAATPDKTTIAILAINDVYRIEGTEEGRRGGLARLRTLRRELDQRYAGRLLVLHAGDVLYPSFLSRMYDGAQMIDAMNMLDGDDHHGQLDDRMYVAFGNHEFEKETCDPAKSPVLQHRVRQSQFFWLHSNIVFKPCADGRPRIENPNVLESTIVRVGDVRVGLLSLTIDTPGNGFQFNDPLDVGRQRVAELRKQGADVVIAVTHLEIQKDREIYDALKGDGLDLIIGGHDHARVTYPERDPRVFKADADAVTAWVLELRTGTSLDVNSTLHSIDTAVPEDPVVASRVAGWMRAHENSFCKDDATRAKSQVDPTCLAVKIGTTTTALEGGETEIRERETGLGNWITDEMMKAFEACQPSAAVITSGTLRLNQTIAPGTSITRRHMEELIGYPAPLFVHDLTADQVRRMAANAVQKVANGGWMQMSGLSLVYDARTKALTTLRVMPKGSQPSVDLLNATSARTIRIVTSDFVATGEDDGFKPIFAGSPRASCSGATGVVDPSHVDLKKLLMDALARDRTISPVVQGRICTTDDERQRLCLAASGK